MFGLCGVLTSPGESAVRKVGRRILLFNGEGDGCLLLPLVAIRGVLWTPVVLEGESMTDSSSSSFSYCASMPVIVSSSASCWEGVWKVLS